MVQGFLHSHQILQCVLPKTWSLSQGTSPQPQNGGYLWFPHYNPIHRTSSTFISCPSFVQQSFFILMQFSFPGAITGAFPHVKNLHGFKETRWLWSGWLFSVVSFTENVFSAFPCCAMCHFFFHCAYKHITTFIIWVILSMNFYSINCTHIVKISPPFISRIFSFSWSDTVTIKYS